MQCNEKLDHTRASHRVKEWLMLDNTFIFTDSIFNIPCQIVVSDIAGIITQPSNMEWMQSLSPSSRDRFYKLHIDPLGVIHVAHIFTFSSMLFAASIFSMFNHMAVMWTYLQHLVCWNEIETKTFGMFSRIPIKKLSILVERHKLLCSFPKLVIKK